MCGAPQVLQDGINRTVSARQLHPLLDLRVELRGRGQQLRTWRLDGSLLQHHLSAYSCSRGSQSGLQL